MFDQLQKNIQEHVSLSDEEWNMCKNNFRPKRMLKRQFLLQEGDVCRELTFVEKGALYSYAVDSKGNQHVLRFAFGGWWVADLQSFFTDTPSTLNTEILEDSELLVLDRKNHEKLLKEIPVYERYHRVILQNAYIAMQQRLENALVTAFMFARFSQPHAKYLLTRVRSFCLNLIPHILASRLFFCTIKKINI